MQFRSKLDHNGAYEEAHQYVKRSIECLRLGYDFCRQNDGDRLEHVKQILKKRTESPISDPSDAQANDYIRARLFPTFHGYVPVRHEQTEDGKQRAYLRGEVASSASQSRSYCVFAQSTDAEYIQSFGGSSRLFYPFLAEFRVSSSSTAAQEVRNCAESAVRNLELGGRLASIIDEYDAPYDPDQVQTGYIGYALEIEIR